MTPSISNEKTKRISAKDYYQKYFEHREDKHQIQYRDLLISKQQQLQEFIYLG